ncbi:MAG: 50S ribosomal protein L19 [Gemmataceae bacterium]
MKNKLISLVEAADAKPDLPNFAVGDTVDIHQRILEGQKERIQIFSGTLIARRGDKGREMITVRRLVQGEGVERVFPVNSPKIAKIDVKRSGETRRSKLYYLRDRVGKATKLREREIKPSQVDVADAPAPAAQPAAEATPRPTPAPKKKSPAKA